VLGDDDDDDYNDDNDDPIKLIVLDQWSVFFRYFKLNIPKQN